MTGLRAWGSEDLDDEAYFEPDPERHNVPCAERWADEVGCDDGHWHQCMHDEGHRGYKHPCRCGAFVLEDTRERRADVDFSRTLAALDGDAGLSIYTRADLDEFACFDDFEPWDEP